MWLILSSAAKMNENEGWTQGVLHYYIALARSVTQQAETYRVPTYLDKIPLLLNDAMVRS